MVSAGSYDHSSDDLVIARIVKRYNAECGYKRVVREDGTVSGDTSLGATIEKFLSKDESSSSAVSTATYGKIEYDLTIQGMNVRLFHLLDIDPILSTLGFTTTGYYWRVVDIQYDITESGPMTTCSVTAVDRPLNGAKARRTTGRVSMAQAIEKTIDAKLFRQQTKGVPFTTIAQMEQLFTLTGGNTYKLRFYVRAQSSIPYWRGQSVNVNLGGASSGNITTFNTDWTEVITDAYVCPGTSQYALAIIASADNCTNWIPLYVDQIEVLDGSNNPVSPNITNGGFETTSPALYGWEVGNSEIVFTSSGYQPYSGTACLKISSTG